MALKQFCGTFDEAKEKAYAFSVDLANLFSTLGDNYEVPEAIDTVEFIFEGRLAPGTTVKAFISPPREGLESIPDSEGREGIAEKTTLTTTFTLKCILEASREGFVLHFGPTDRQIWLKVGMKVQDAAIITELTARNIRIGFRRPDAPEITALKSSGYMVQTAQEWAAIGEAASMGTTGKNWKRNEQAKTIQYHRKGLHHTVQLSAASRNTLELTEDYLLNLVKKMNSYCVFSHLYIADVLVEQGGGWIDLNDVAKKIGYNPQTAKDAADCRREVYEHIIFGVNAVVIGDRSIPYKDKITGKTIDTAIYSSLWSITDEQKPTQLSLLNDPVYGAVPVAVRLVLSAQWEALLKNPNTRQVLPFGELLGSIPGKQPSGALARVIGLTLLDCWRRRSQETLRGKFYESRRDLLTTYQPTGCDPLEILNSGNPGHIIEYYYNALAVLVEKGVIAPEGDAAPRRNRREGLLEQGWAEQWLKAVPEICPGAMFLPYLESIANNRYIEKPKDLKAIPRKKRAKKEA